MKFDIILTQPLKQVINIDKIGMIIRPLTKDEKDIILNKMDSLYFEKKAKYRINKYIQSIHDEEQKNYVNYMKYLQSKFYNNLTDNEKSADFYYYQFIKESHRFTKIEMQKIINTTVIIELDNKIDDFIDVRFKKYVVSKIIKFLLYITTKNSLNDINKENITCDAFSIFSDEELLNYTWRLLNCTSKRDSNILSVLDLNIKEFDKFKAFITKTNKERIRDFFLIIDTLFNNNSSFENNIVAFTSIIERLLIKHDTNYDIGKQFVLKFGLVLRENNQNFDQSGVKYLNFCYSVRSCIVHGDDTKIIDIPRKYLKISDEELDYLTKAKNHHSKRNRVLLLCSIFLENNTRIPLKEWIYNPNKIEFLKNN